MKSSSDGYENNRYIHVQNQERFYIEKPEWDIEWMAHAMAQTARYRGHADIQYSVAEHSVLVSLLMQEETGGDPFEGVLHDAAESVLPDVSSPFKGLFPDLRKWEKTLSNSIRAQWPQLPATKSDACSTADWLALFIEAAQILPERGEDFEDPYNLRPRAMDLREAGWRVQGLQWQDAKAVLLQRYVETRK